MHVRQAELSQGCVASKSSQPQTYCYRSKATDVKQVSRRNAYPCTSPVLPKITIHLVPAIGLTNSSPCKPVKKSFIISSRRWLSIKEFCESTFKIVLSFSDQFIRHGSNLRVRAASYTKQHQTAAIELWRRQQDFQQHQSIRTIIGTWLHRCVLPMGRSEANENNFNYRLERRSTGLARNP